MKAPIFRRLTVAACAMATLLLAPSCEPASSDAARENALLAEAKAANDTEGLLAVQAIEPKALAAGQDGASRDDSRLILHLRSGATKTYEDRPECKNPKQELDCESFRLIVYARSRGVFLLVKGYYEAAEYILIDDATGEETVVRNLPIFSPFGARILVLLMNDEELGYAVQIWRREGDKFVFDWSSSPHVAGIYTSYDLVRWPSEDTIELQSENHFEPPKPRVRTRFSLHRTGRGWEVVETK